MTLTSSCRIAAGAVASVVMLAACGSTPTASPTVSAAVTAQPPTSSSSPSSSGTNNALKVALAVTDLPSAVTGFVQTTDGLLGTTPNTDSRVFANSDNTTRIEIDLAADSGSSAAATDYAAYKAAAAKQVTTQASTSTPTLGQQANEYVGTDTNNHSAVSLSFYDGSYIVVVTMVSSAATVESSVVEAIAMAQDAKITANP